MGDVIVIAGHHVCASHASVTEREGRGTFPGQLQPAGQWSENHCKVRSNRLTWISAPRSSAPSFLVSPQQRQLTWDRSRPSVEAYARATASNDSIPSMNPISVKLPHSSRVILPKDKLVNSGYPTGMATVEDLNAWLDERRAALKLNDSELARKCGIPVHTIQNIRKKAAWPKIDKRRKLATLGNAPPWLMDDNSPAPSQSEFVSPTISLAEIEAQIAETEQHLAVLRRMADIVSRKKTG